MKEQLAHYLRTYPAVPVTIQYQDPHFNPLSVFKTLNNPKQPAFLLTGKPKKQEDGYSFICLHPEKSYCYRDHTLVTTDFHNGKQESSQTDFSLLVNQLLAKYQMPRIKGLPPFTGGLTGYFAYDYAKYATKQLDRPIPDTLQLNDAELLLTKTVIAFNHRTRTVTLSQVLSKDDFANHYQETINQLQDLKKQLGKPMAITKSHFQLKGPFHFQFDLNEFVQHVKATQQHIIDGDIFQLILSDPQRAQISGSLLATADRLFHDNPSPYQFYFHDDDYEIIGASPETLITKRQQSLYTYPLAGTRRRGKTKQEDEWFAKELQTSPKETSEHNMLIDLGRNDLGRISKFGTVHVSRKRQLLKFSNVMHLGSTVESTVADKISGMDIIKSVLPAGTLAGAPKVSAMKIIQQLEQRKRGVYGGCLGYFSFDGNLDFCIGIRLAYRKKDQLVIHSGAGIVADSIPQQEYQEFNNKARGIKDSIIAVAKEDKQ